MVRMYNRNMALNWEAIFLPLNVTYKKKKNTVIMLYTSHKIISTNKPTYYGK